MSPELLIALNVALLIAVVAIVVFVMRRRRRPDGVAAFQRQIDALSPEARRPVVDQVQQLEDGELDDDEPNGAKGRDGS